jgi:hypothetical protein
MAGDSIHVSPGYAKRLRQEGYDAVTHRPLPGAPPQSNGSAALRLISSFVRVREI